MGIWGDLVKAALPIVGGVIGGPVGAAIGAGVSGMLGGRDKANQQTAAGREAGRTAMGGFNYTQASPIGQTYLPAGAAALEQEQALLGIGGDPAKAQAGYNNYLNSIGFQDQLRAGQRSITTSRAAAGLLGSGSTAKALQAHGQELSRQSFQNYLGNLRGISGMGLQAGGILSNSAGQAYGQAAQYQYGAGQAAAETSGSAFDQLLGGAGAAYDAWKAGRTKTTSSGGVDTTGATWKF